MLESIHSAPVEVVLDESIVGTPPELYPYPKLDTRKVPDAVKDGADLIGGLNCNAPPATVVVYDAPGALIKSAYALPSEEYI